MKKNFTLIAKTTLVLVYLVIIAGALVRMTGSGMGCPDWPKCFGYYIPPTSEKELLLEPNRNFEKGQVIIQNQTLLVANSDFTSRNTFDATQWEVYTKHDYAIFNVYHTWIEYINRLFGALAGIGTLVMAIAAISFWKINKKIPLLSLLVVALMGFQAWLGATVVYSVLNPIKITLHMVMALVIVAVILYIIFASKTNVSNKPTTKKFKMLVAFALVMSLIQIVLGTQVRQFVDEQVKSGLSASILWLQNPALSFYFHRSFSILLVLVNAILFLENKSKKLLFDKVNTIMALLGLEILSGIAMVYFDFPFGTQAIHLVFASILFGIQFYLQLEQSRVSS